MNRREALQKVALLTGGLVIGADFFLAGCKRGLSQVNTLFNQDYVDILNEVGETILPATKTPGAKEANVGAFMAAMVQDGYSPADQQVFVNGLPKINVEANTKFGKSFIDCSWQQRTELLNMIDAGWKEDIKTSGKKYQYYGMIKQLVLLGYFTSEPGSTQALRYVAVPGRYDGSYPYKKGDKAWAL